MAQLVFGLHKKVWCIHGRAFITTVTDIFSITCHNDCPDCVTMCVSDKSRVTFIGSDLNQCHVQASVLPQTTSVYVRAFHLPILYPSLRYFAGLKLK